MSAKKGEDFANWYQVRRGKRRGGEGGAGRGAAGSPGGSSSSGGRSVHPSLTSFSLHPPSPFLSLSLHLSLSLFPRRRSSWNPR
jgi:hypothetical protein